MTIGQPNLAHTATGKEIKIDGRSMPVWRPAEWRRVVADEIAYFYAPATDASEFYSEKADWIIVITGTAKAAVCLMQAEEAVETQRNSEGVLPRFDAWSLPDQNEMLYFEAYARLEKLHKNRRTTRSEKTRKIHPREAARGAWLVTQI